MRKGWETCNLEDFITLIDYRGKTPIKTESGIRLITAKNVKLGFLQTEPQEFIAEDNYDSWMTRGIPNYGDVIFTTEAPLANVAQIDTHDKLAFAQRIIVMQPRANKIDSTFLKYMLLSPDVRSEILGKGTGATVQGIKQSLLRKVRISFPQLPEQQRIVSILDEAFEAIDQAKANTERNLQNARELFQSELNRIFTNKGESWVEKKLGDLAVFRNGMNFTKQSNGESIKLVGVKDFQSRFWIDLQGLDSVTIDGSLNETDFLKENDILAVRSNGNPELIGRCMLAGPVTEKTSHSGFTIRIRLNSDNIYPPYLCHYLKSTKAKAELIESGTGISIRSLNQGALATLEIPFPSFSEQKNIVSLFDTLSAETKQLEANYQKKLESLEELKKSILQKAFSGELTRETTEIKMEQLDRVAEEQAMYNPNQ